MRTSDIAAIALGISAVALGGGMWLLDQRLTEVESRLTYLEMAQREARWDGKQLSSPDGEKHIHSFFGSRRDKAEKFYRYAATAPANRIAPEAP